MREMEEETEITELRLGPPRASSVDTSDGGKSKKRAFMQTAEDESSTTEEGEILGLKRAAEYEEPAVKGRVVGWPPVCAYRLRNGGGGGSRRVYVKVSMDGAPFLRKVELDACKGYGDLTAVMQGLFAILSGGSDGGEYTQIYEDKEGDWMLVGDVPWEMFIESCKRLRLMKSSEAKGFGLQLRTPHGGGDQEDVM